MRQYQGFTSIGGKNLSQIPQALFDNLGAFFNDKDIEIIEFMGHGSMDKAFKIDSLNNRFKESEIQDAYKKGIISKCEDEELSYINSPLTKEETIELLKKTEEMGLVHSIESHAICNCCTCCCYPIRGSFALDLVHSWPEHAYRVIMNEDDCISCGACIDRCPFGVFKDVDQEIKAETMKCWGCGICTSTCPVEALSLEKI